MHDHHKENGIFFYENHLIFWGVSCKISELLLSLCFNSWVNRVKHSKNVVYYFVSCFCLIHFHLPWFVCKHSCSHLHASCTVIYLVKKFNATVDFLINEYHHFAKLIVRALTHDNLSIEWYKSINMAFVLVKVMPLSDTKFILWWLCYIWIS